jgi:hypothetical protein
MLKILEDRKLPWHVQPPYEGCNTDEPERNHMPYSVWDEEGNLVCECSGEDDGREEAVAIATIVNRTGPATCATCGEPATCFGAYEDGLCPAFSCDECCGHGCEDGYCEQLDPSRDNGS